uniref:Uncharacterized protein n=1 Tax=Populus trichocarpa TaxID=3694 RepID=A0A3N7ET16_POPTR
MLKRQLVLQHQPQLRPHHQHQHQHLLTLASLICSLLLAHSTPSLATLNPLRSLTPSKTKPTTLMKALPSSYQKMMPSKILRSLLCQT